MKANCLKKIEDWRRNKKIQREKPEIWLLEDRKIGYIQIPKVATRSIQQCLANYYVVQKKIQQPPSWSNSEIKIIEEKTAFHASHKYLYDLSTRFFIFAFVRNPYDRIFSAYKNKVLHPSELNGKNIFRNHGVFLGMKFSEFIDVVSVIPDNKIDRHLRSQSWFLCHEEKLIPEYIGHLESFDNDWEKINSRFNLGSPKHKNATKSLNIDDYSEQYTHDLEEKVFNRYKKDFELFGYKRLEIKR
jgi:dermatan 4-sulfotransferase 1